MLWFLSPKRIALWLMLVVPLGFVWSLAAMSGVSETTMRIIGGVSGLLIAVLITSFMSADQRRLK